MKKIGIVIDNNKKLFEFLASNLKEVLGDRFEFYDFYTNNMRSLDDMDLVLVMINERILKILPYITETKKIITVNRTISKDMYEKLREIDGYLNIVIINDTVETTMELVATFYKLGIGDKRFLPYNSNEVYDDTILAITANEEHLIPEGMEYFNIGYRPIDISTFIEIISKLDVPLEQFQDALEIYHGRYMALDKKSENRIMLTRKVGQLNRALKRESLKKGFVAKHNFDSILTTSENMLKCIEKAKKLAGHEINVLINGESGTGKELFAQSIHNASPRKYNPFMGVNVTAIPSNLLESELFGYVDGAFTGARKSGRQGIFEQCAGGTLFLDEIGDMKLEMQGKLLRVLEERCIMPVGGDQLVEVDVRIIAATNKDLLRAISEGRFRDDLYYRLKASIIKIPPLRARGGDAIFLAKCFLPEDITITTEAHDILSRYKWYGNVRELKNTCDYIRIMDEDGVIDIQDVPEDILSKPSIDQNLTLDLYANKDKIQAVLKSIDELSRVSSSVGRMTILKYLSTNGWNISESEIKNILKELKANGYIIQQKGRKGAVLTREGEKYHLDMES